MDKINFQELRDKWALKAPAPTSSDIQVQQSRDHNLNPYNESGRPDLRSLAEIHSDLAYNFADAVLLNQYPNAYKEFLDANGYSVAVQGRTKNWSNQS